MTRIGVYEARTRPAELISHVERGDHFIITRHGTPVAILYPAGESPRLPPEEVIAALKTFRRGCRLDGLSVQEMVEEGRL